MAPGTRSSILQCGKDATVQIDGCCIPSCCPKNIHALTAPSVLHFLYSVDPVCIDALTYNFMNVKVTCPVFIVSTGARVAEAWPSQAVTHVVCKVDENRRARRTLKYMRGVASRAWVVDADWVRACLAAGEPQVIDSGGPWSDCRTFLWQTVNRLLYTENTKQTTVHKQH